MKKLSVLSAFFAAFIAQACGGTDAASGVSAVAPTIFEGKWIASCNNAGNGTSTQKIQEFIGSNTYQHRYYYNNTTCAGTYSTTDIRTYFTGPFIIEADNASVSGAKNVKISDTSSGGAPFTEYTLMKISGSNLYITSDGSTTYPTTLNTSDSTITWTKVQ